MHQEPIFQELIDATLRGVLVVGLVLLFYYRYGVQIESLRPFRRSFLEGALFGGLAWIAMVSQFPISLGHAIDLRVIPLVLAAPVAGIPAGLWALAFSLLGEALLLGIGDVPNLVSMLAATIVGSAVALNLGRPWRGGAARRALSMHHVLVLAFGGSAAALVSEIDIFRPRHFHLEPWLPIALYLLLIPGAIGLVGALIVEITARRRSLQDQEIEAERIMTIGSYAPGIVYRRILRSDGTEAFLFVSEQVKTILGLDANGIVADPNVYFSQMHPADRGDVEAKLARAAAGDPEMDPLVLEYRMIRPDGRTVWLQSRSRINKAASQMLGAPVADGIAVDITSHKEAEAVALEHQRRLLWFAEHDELTGLLNRNGLERRCKERNRRAAGRSALFVELDLRRSHVFNELFGPSCGDQRLIETSLRLEKSAGNEALVARVGGDEFAIFTEDRDAISEPRRFAERIARDLAEPMALPCGEQAPPAADMGFAVFEEQNAAFDNMLQATGMALEQARKCEQAAIIAYTPEIKAVRTEQHKLDSRLAQALVKKELSLFAQPIVVAADLRVEGHEILVRWPQADGSFISPSVFVARAQQIGLWRKLDSFILKHACCQAARSSDDLWISVNMTPGWLIEGTLVGQVQRVLAETGLAPRRLCIEVTEWSILNNFASAAQQLEALIKMGVAVALDDFGTGYSSLSYLNSLPITKLKIDKSFIDGITTSQRAQAIVEGIIKLASDLSISTIAEGVETQEQLDWLRTHGCDSIQGYLVARPAPLQVPS